MSKPNDTQEPSLKQLERKAQEDAYKVLDPSWIPRDISAKPLLVGIAFAAIASIPGANEPLFTALSAGAFGWFLRDTIYD